MASCLHLANLTTGTLPVGTMVIVEEGKARAFDEKTDSLDNVIGCIYATQNVSYRAFNIGDGPAYYDFDYYTWNGNLTSTEVENPNYQTWAPWTDTENWSTIVTHGFCCVLNSYEALPARWQIIKSDVDGYHWVLTR